YQKGPVKAGAVALLGLVVVQERHGAETEQRPPNLFRTLVHLGRDLEDRSAHGVDPEKVRDPQRIVEYLALTLGATPRLALRIPKPRHDLVDGLLRMQVIVEHQSHDGLVAG